jgi:hypothetical protein
MTPGFGGLGFAGYRRMKGGHSAPFRRLIISASRHLESPPLGGQLHALSERGAEVQPEAGACLKRGSRSLRGRLRQRVRFELTVALRRKILGPRRRQFGLRGFEIGKKGRFGMKARNRGRPNESALDDIALPMDITNEAAFAEGAAARKICFALIG